MPGKCGRCKLPLGSPTMIAYKQEFHMKDCFPRERFEREGTEFVECHICHKADGLGWMLDTKMKLIERKLCFDCNFWFEYAQRAEDPDVVRIEGHHFVIGEEKPGFMSRGFGGRKFRIAFNDGRVIDTTNLWSQGQIAEEWVGLMPDNAKFVEVPTSALA